MRYRLRTLMTQFSIRDLLWLTLVFAVLTAWWHSRRENAALRDENLARSETMKVKAQALEFAAKKEASLRKEVELVGQLARNREVELAKRTDEQRESLKRREEVLEALRSIQTTPAPSN